MGAIYIPILRRHGRGPRRYLVYALFEDGTSRRRPYDLSDSVYIGMTGAGGQRRLEQHRQSNDVNLVQRDLFSRLSYREAIYIEARLKHRVKEMSGEWPKLNRAGCEAEYGRCPVCPWSWSVNKGHIPASLSDLEGIWQALIRHSAGLLVMPCSR